MHDGVLEITVPIVKVEEKRRTLAVGNSGRRAWMPTASSFPRRGARAPCIAPKCPRPAGTIADIRGVSTVVFRRGDAPTPVACYEKNARLTPVACTVAPSGCARPGRVVYSTTSGASPAAAAGLRRAVRWPVSVSLRDSI